MRNRILLLLAVLVAMLLLAPPTVSAQSPLPNYIGVGGIGFDTNAPATATPGSSLPGWTNQLNGWGTFGAKVDTNTYSFTTVHLVAGTYTLTTGFARVVYRQGYVSFATILDAGLTSSSNATGSAVNLGGILSYDLGGMSKRLAGFSAMGVFKAAYTSVTPAPATGYQIKPVFMFGLSRGF